MSLEATIATDLGPLRLRADVRAAPGEVLALVGPNGAGKTTLLRALAGLVPGATVLIDGEDVSEHPPERRPVGFVFQDLLLFPHLSALDNVAYGLGGPDRRSVAARWLDRVGLADRAGDRPGSLSGGQAQRVALARTLARRPRLLLLDEPLAALDPATRAEVRRDLRRHLDEHDGVAVVVTHDPVDAAALADRVLVLDGGCITEGTAAEVFGTNLVRGTATAGTITTPAGATIVTATAVEATAIAVIPPAAVALHLSPPAGSPRNVWQATVRSLASVSGRTTVRLEGPVPLVATVTVAAAEALGLRPGSAVWAAVKATEIDAYPV